MDVETCVVDEPTIAADVEDTSLRFDVIGPMDSDGDPSGLEDKLRVGVPTTEVSLSLFEDDVD